MYENTNKRSVYTVGRCGFFVYYRVPNKTPVLKQPALKGLAKNREKNNLFIILPLTSLYGAYFRERDVYKLKRRAFKTALRSQRMVSYNRFLIYAETSCLVLNGPPVDVVLLATCLTSRNINFCVKNALRVTSIEADKAFLGTQTTPTLLFLIIY